MTRFQPLKSLTSITLTASLAVALLSQISPALAACQPYRPNPAFLKQLEEGKFTSFLPGAQPLTPEQKEKLQSLARAQSPEQIGELAQLEGFWMLFSAASVPIPISGPAPLTVPIRYSGYPIPDPVKIEFDADGDGKPEWVQEGRDSGMPREYIYRQEGQYAASLRIYDSGGQVHTVRIPVKVMSPAQFDSDLQAVWNNLKEALRRGEIPAALECIHTGARARYNQAFRAITSLPQKVDEVLTTIRFVEHRRGEAEYEMLRTDSKRGTLSYLVRFNIDVDGIWRIRMF